MPEGEMLKLILISIGIVLAIAWIFRIRSARPPELIVEGVVKNISERTEKVAMGYWTLNYRYPVIDVQFTYEGVQHHCGIGSKQSRMYREAEISVSGEQRPPEYFFWNSILPGHQVRVSVDRGNIELSRPLFPTSGTYESETKAIGLSAAVVLLVGVALFFV